MNVIFTKPNMSELIEQLDSNNKDVAEAAKQKITELFSTVKDSWLVTGLFDYYLKANSVRTMDVLINVPDFHHSYLFDRLSESVKNKEIDIRVHALTLLGHVARNQPTWLYNIKDHQLLKDILKILKNEVEYLPLISALLIIVVLMPVIPSHFGDFLKDIFEIFSRLASWQNTPGKAVEEQLLHLQMSFYALFLRLYGMYPCNFIAYLRSQYKDKYRPIFAHTIKPMLLTVKMHPSIITSSKDNETSTERWKTMSAHDVIVECESYALDLNEKCFHELRFSAGTRCKTGTTNSILEKPISLEMLRSPDPFAASEGKEFFSASFLLRSDSPGISDATSPNVHQPHLSASGVSQSDLEVIEGQSCYSQGSSPPETAVEATPETTPIRGDNGSNGTIPPKHKNVATSPLRIHPESGNSFRNNYSPRTQEDEEVLSITGGNSDLSRHPISRQCDSVLHDNDGVECSESIYDDPEHGSPCSAGGLHMPNFTDCARKVQRLRYHSQCNPDFEEISTGSSPVNNTLFPANTTVRRASSCPEMKKTQVVPLRDAINKPLKETDEESAENQGDSNDNVKKSFMDSETQTENFWPMPYEHLFLGMFPRLERQELIKTSPAQSPQAVHSQGTSSQPSVYELFEKYIETAARGEQENTSSKDKVQLQLLYQQLLFERHRRETHAYRNRRLFPELRNTRYLEEINSALMDQIQLQQTDIDNLKSQIEILKGTKFISEDKYPKVIGHFEKEHNHLNAEIQQLKEKISKLEMNLKEMDNKRIEEISVRKQTEDRLRDVLAEVKVTREQAQEAEKCKLKISRLNKDLLMAGELVEKYKQKLIEEVNKPNHKNELITMRQACNNQTRSLEPQLIQKTLHLDATKARVSELEKKIANSEDNVNSMKRLLKEADNHHEHQLHAVNSKYLTQVKINQALEEKIIELYAITDRQDARSPDLSSCQEVDLSSLSVSVISSEQGTRQPDTQDAVNLQELIDQASVLETGKAELSEEELSLPGTSKVVTFQDASQAGPAMQPSILPEVAEVFQSGPSQFQKTRTGISRSPKIGSPQEKPTRETGKASK